MRGQFMQYFLTSSFYPPVFNLVTTGYFVVGGASVFTGRLVAVTFSMLSVLAVYAIAEKMYDAKTALLSAILLGVMPGIIWLSRIALIETMLVFVFSVSMLFFFRWLTTNRERDRIVSIIALAIGVAVKYQMLVLVPIIMLVHMLIFNKRQYLKNEVTRLFRYPKIILTTILVTTVAIVVFTVFATKLIDPWIYSILAGPTDRSVYATRFPTPVFYFIEMTWPLSIAHPISIFLYVVGLAGLVLFVVRKKTQDKFLLIWFAIVYVVFTIIPNREWRYMTPLFPVLAISAASLITLSYNALQKVWQSNSSLFRKRFAKLSAIILIALTASSIIYSCVDAYYWVEFDEFPVPIEQAADYIAQSLQANQSVAVACPLNLLNADMVWFCLNTKTPSQTSVWQYPNLAVDAYAPNFNTTEFVNFCQQNNTRYVFLYENGKTNHYFNSTLTELNILDMLNSTGRYTLQANFGIEPNRILVLSYE